MTTKALADWLATVVATDLAVTTAKGSAAYNRPPTGEGNAYIEWQELTSLEPVRIGQTVTRWSTRFRLIVVTGNEIDMWTLVDGLRTMTQARIEATIDDKRYKVHWSSVERAEPSEDTIEALRYAAVTQITITE